MIMENMIIYSSYRYILKDTCALKIRENFDKLGGTKHLFIKWYHYNCKTHYKLKKIFALKNLVKDWYITYIRAPIEHNE